MLAGSVSAQEAPGETFAETRALLEEWVRTKSLLSEEAAQWEVEKRILQDIAEVARGELDELNKGLARVNESKTAGEAAKEALLQRQQELKAMVGRIELRLPSLEASLLERMAWFPQPLRQKVEVYQKRIPRPDSTAPKQNFLVRAQNLAVILREADEFNGRITLDRPVLKIGSEGERVYDVLYFGLAVAYFVDTTGKVGGIGTPARGGWQWTLDDRIAPLVREAVQMRNNEILAEFLELPQQPQGGAQ